MASKVFSSLGLSADDEIDLEQCCQLLDLAEVFLIKAQTKRLFDAVDLKKSGRLSILDFENLLIAYDVLDLAHVGIDLVLLDVFDSFKTTSVERQFRRELKQQQKKEQEAEQKMNEKAKSDDEDEDESRTKQKGKKKNDDNDDEPLPEGVDYSSFCEAVQLLGSKQQDPEALKEAFCTGGNVSVNMVDQKFLVLEEFRKAYLMVADLPQEMKRRKMKADSGLFGASRNRERLGRAMQDVEIAYAEGLGRVVAFIEKVKMERRKKKDDRRREAEAYRENLLHEAQRFQALRGQEKRIQIKKEQEEQAKKRVEVILVYVFVCNIMLIKCDMYQAKVLKNKLLQRQQEAQLQKQREIQALSKQGELLRQAEIRAAGLDKLDLSVRDLRTLPSDLYESEAAQTKLTYLVFCDLSRNLLDRLPNEFCYWMAALKQLKLSGNRLTEIPQDIGTQLANLQVTKFITEV